MPQRKRLALWIALSLLLLFPASAKAYVDPGTGSYVLQMVLAGLLGALFALKVFWHRMVGFFKRRFGRGGRTIPPSDE